MLVVTSSVLVSKKKATMLVQQVLTVFYPATALDLHNAIRESVRERTGAMMQSRYGVSRGDAVREPNHRDRRDL